ncbi:MAG: helix-turn-helix transcriptional regulator [Kiritimatiellaeota bacterium]|nr:helix-turn-helix transcriptional regulator [Kiritimatiellota bacterium]MCX7010223.1 helix-turn-helix transcriptional regulator [Kiritimatiellota bacterium]
MKKLHKGWVEGSVAEFLDLKPADMEYIETRRSLSRQLRLERQRQHLTQTALATRLKTSQSRVAKMEQGDATVSLDLLIQSLYRVGMTRKEVAAAL